MKTTQRLCARLRGAVQGVGFRPFVYRLAVETGLKGRVQNTAQGVLLEAEGPRQALKEFADRLLREKPPRAAIETFEKKFTAPAGYADFRIVPSEDVHRSEERAWVMPDIAVCKPCLDEMWDSGNRRFLYPFINCSHCGPRFTIVEDLPYDRARTSMKTFAMCKDCREEYEAPANRRFHAEPIACPRCGPHLEFWNASGLRMARHHEALLRAAEALRQGLVVAVKGIGGFHLFCDARNGDAVGRLRMRKHREEKPFALMAPDREALRRIAHVRAEEREALRSPAAPIVLLKKKQEGGLAEGIAPGNPLMGVLLPYAPLHHLIMEELGFPVIATSANVAEEPICKDGDEALLRLKGIADCFLTHNRPIVRHADDSIVRFMAGRISVLRRARGYAPMPVSLPAPRATVIALGAQLKSAVCLASGHAAFLSQHLGDLENRASREAFADAVRDLPRLFGAQPAVAVADAHPDYASTLHAHKTGLPLKLMQHHHAHIAACMAENGRQKPVLGVAWDGSGWGPDGTVWGGEFLRVTVKGYERFAHFRHFALLGGEAAVREPRRAALALMQEIFGPESEELREANALWQFSQAEIKILQGMLRASVNAPKTSSAGRLFDAVASLLNLRQISRYEGQAAMQVEWAGQGAAGENGHYPFTVSQRGVVDWEPLFRALWADVRAGFANARIAMRFHNTLAEIIAAVAEHVGEKHVALSGGCFQNRLLLEHAIERLRQRGFVPLWHREIPPNDGGIALGQAVIEAWGQACA